MRDLSSTAVNSITAEETAEVWLVLLTISHDDLASSIRVVNNIEDITSNGHTFLGCPFEIELPSETADGPGIASIKIDNVDRRIVEAIRIIQSPPSVTIQVVLASDPDTIEMEVEDLVLADASYDVGSVRGTLQFEDLTIEPCNEIITPERFPAVF